MRRREAVGGGTGRDNTSRAKWQGGGTGRLATGDRQDMTIRRYAPGLGREVEGGVGHGRCQSALFAAASMLAHSAAAAEPAPAPAPPSAQPAPDRQPAWTQLAPGVERA